MAESKKDRSQQRAYTVVRVSQAGSMDVQDPARQARSQEHACDQVVADLPADQRHGTFAAFLARSYQEFTYSSEQTVVTTKQRSQLSFGEAPGINDTLPGSDAT